MGKDFRCHTVGHMLCLLFDSLWTWPFLGRFFSF